jgi:hypothetical protein
MPTCLDVLACRVHEFKATREELLKSKGQWTVFLPNAKIRYKAVNSKPLMREHGGHKGKDVSSAENFIRRPKDLPLRNFHVPYSRQPGRN